MQPFNFDEYYKRLEHAGEQEAEATRQELRTYLTLCSPQERETRMQEYNEYLRYSSDRLDAEIAFVKELLQTAHAA